MHTYIDWGREHEQNTVASRCGTAQYYAAAVCRSRRVCSSRSENGARRRRRRRRTIQLSV